MLLEGLHHGLLGAWIMWRYLDVVTMFDQQAELVGYQVSSGRYRCWEAALTQLSRRWLTSSQWPPILTMLRRFSQAAGLAPSWCLWTLGRSLLRDVTMLTLTFQLAASELVTRAAMFQATSWSPAQGELSCLDWQPGEGLRKRQMQESRPKRVQKGVLPAPDCTQTLLYMFNKAPRWATDVTDFV